MTWALIFWSVLTVFWITAGLAGTDCGEETSEAAKAGCEAGTGIGVAFVLFVGFLGFVVLSLIWFMTRPKQ